MTSSHAGPRAGGGGDGGGGSGARTPSSSSGNIGALIMDLSGRTGKSSSGSGSFGGLSVREKQRSALLDMLRMCAPPLDDDEISFGSAGFGGGAGSGGHDNKIGINDEDPAQVWKVLVYDAAARDIIAPLLRVADLRAHGVTLHMMLGTARQPIPDVPAVYFVSPTRENILRIAADARNGLYHSLWINFTSSIPRIQLETLADALATSQILAPTTALATALGNAPAPSGAIARVFDMYTDFLSLEDDLFNLNLPGAFTSMNARNVSDIDIQATVQCIVDRLYCVIVTLGTVPVIRAQRSGPAEMVAALLEKRIRESLVSGNNIFTDTPRHAGSFAPSTARPLLVLLDRTIDLPVMLHHTWTYQALAHDSLSLRLNRVTIPIQDQSNALMAVGASKHRTFDLDKDDAFWATNAGLPFPMVAEAVETALKDYTAEVEVLNQSAIAVGAASDPPIVKLDTTSNFPNTISQNGGDAGHLAAAILTLPQLTKKKQMIDLHTNIATALLNSIKDRGLDGYFQVEEELMTRPQSFDVERILALLRHQRGSVIDKLRLFLIYYLCIEGLSSQQLNQCTSALQEAGCEDLRAYSYLKSIKAFTSTMATVASSDPSASSSGINSSYAAVLGTLSQVASNVHNLILSADKALPTARVLSTLMNQKGDADVLDGYRVFDPRTPKGSGISVSAKRVFSEAIVFIVGPGNYIEYQNCKDHVCSTVRTEGNAKRMVPNGKTVIYGATELCNGTEFLEQLQSLEGTKSAAAPSAGDS